mgnify:FL=1
MGKIIGGELPTTVAIPTTAGTGSEATQFTIITDTQKDVKMLLKGAVLMPDYAIIDPQFTMTAPPKITAATGLDALTHAAEAYTSNLHSHYLIHLHYQRSKESLNTCQLHSMMERM